MNKNVEYANNFCLKRKVTLANNPFLMDHVIGGFAVLPITCATYWMIQSVAQLFPHYYFSAVHDFRVLKGIIFDGNEPEVCTVDISERVAKTIQDKVCDVVISGINRHGKLLVFYKGSVVFTKAIPPPITLPLPVFNSDTNVPRPEMIYKDKILFHGPSLQGIVKILTLNLDTIIFESRLPMIDIKNQGQFQVDICNPFIADVQFQGILVWATFCHKTSCLPLGCGEFKQYKLTPFDKTFLVIIDLQKGTTAKISANVFVCDQNGRVYSTLKDASLVASTSLLDLYKQPIQKIAHG